MSVVGIVEIFSILIHYIKYFCYEKVEGCQIIKQFIYNTNKLRAEQCIIKVKVLNALVSDLLINKKYNSYE